MDAGNTPPCSKCQSAAECGVIGCEIEQTERLQRAYGFKQFDHGELNVPLAKRGDINAQLDAYKRQAVARQRADAKVKAAQYKADRARAAEVLANLPADKLERIAQKASITVAQARKQLKSIAYFEPHKVIALATA